MRRNPRFCAERQQKIKPGFFHASGPSLCLFIFPSLCYVLLEKQLLRSFQDNFIGYTDEDGAEHPGYEGFIHQLLAKFPLTESQIIGEQNEKNFISLFGAILRMRNILLSFDEFRECDILPERDLQDYLGRYQDLKAEWAERRKKGGRSDIDDDIVFEVELEHVHTIYKTPKKF